MKGLYCCILILLISSISSFGQVNSIASGDWNNVNTWDCGCIPDFNSGTITISALNTVTIPTGYTTTSDQIVVQGDGILDVSGTLIIANSGGTDLLIEQADFISTFADGLVEALNGGIIESRSVISSNASNLVFQSGSQYQHNQNGGAIPTATWQSLSTCSVTGVTSTAPSGLNQSFHHFVWNSAGQTTASIFLNGQLTTINGDFSVLSSNSKFLGLGYSAGSSSGTTTVGGSVTISGKSKLYVSAVATYTLQVGGSVNISADPDLSSNYPLLGTATGNVTINVSSDFNFSSIARTMRLVASSGTCSLNVSANLSSANGTIEMSAGTGIGTINVSGNVSFTSGTITQTSTGSGAINFNGSGTQLFTGGGTFSNTINFTVSSTSTLDLSTYNVAGTGAFTLNGNLKVGSTNAAGAIQSGTTAGNIRVSGTRTYASGSTITYNGSAAQYVGSGHPASSNVHTVINNSSGVTLAANTTITGNLTLTNGNLSVAAFTLTLEGNFTPNSNFLNVTGTSSITINGSGTFGTLATTGSTTISNLTINRTASGTVTLGSDLTIAGILTQTVGDITLNGHILTISGAFSRTNGSINADASANLIINGSGALPAAVTFAGSQALNTLTVNRSGSTLATTSSLTITNLNLYSGTFDNGGTITMASNGVITRKEGSIINNTPSATTSYDIIYDIASDITTASEIPTVSTALRNVTKTGGALLTLNKAVTINGNLALSNGSLNASTYAIDLKGNFVANAVSTLTSSPVTFSGTTVISGGSPVEFGSIAVTGTLTPSINIQIDGNVVNNGTINAGSATTTFGGTTTISGSSASSFNNIEITGLLTAPTSTTMNVAGNFVNNGTFTHSNGTVTFNGNTSLSGTAATSFYGVTITGAFTAPSSSTLSIAGNFSNTGTFNHNNGTILFNGTTSAQSITGTFTFNNVNISNPSKVNNNGSISLIGTLALVSSGAIDADGSGSGVLTIRSTSVNSGGRVATLGTPANFTGQVTVERFVNGPAGWRYISMPLTNGNAGMWQSIFPVTGNFSNPSPAGVNNVTDSSAPSVYYWNSSTQAYVAVGSGAATGSTSLSDLTGYSPYTYLSGDFTISQRGNIRTGNASISIASSGYALVPNPYPSAIDWDNVTRTGLSNTMSIRVANGVFASYVAGGLATNAPYPGLTGEVATGQSFWIESAGATSLTLTESSKTSGQYQFLREKAPENYLRIALSSESQRDEALVWFLEGASTGFDAAFDARKMRNGYFEPGDGKVSYLNISTRSLGDSTDYAINAISPLSCNTSLNLRVKDVEAGDHTIEFSSLETLSLGYQVVLVDRFMGTEKIVSNGFHYDFIVSDDSTSYADDRFSLRFILPGSAYINSQVPPQINIESPCDPQNLAVNVQTQSNVSYQFIQNGVAIGESFLGNGDFVTFNIPKNQLEEGTNQFDMEASVPKGCDRFVYRDVISYDFVTVDSVYITREGNTLSSNIGDGNQWYKDGELIPDANGSTLDIAESGDYSVQVSFGGCSVQSKNLKVEINPLGEQFFKVYPNPASDKFTLVLPDAIDLELKGISFNDLKGARIFDQDSNPELLLKGKKTVDLTFVQAGMYILTISSADKTYHLKIIRK